MENVSLDQVVDRLRFDNPWWRDGHVSHYHDDMHRRPFFENFYPLVESQSIRRAVVLMGPRRVGKSVMLHHMIDRLLRSGVPSRDICYLSINSPVYGHLYLEQMLKIAIDLRDEESERTFYMFFDEIQYLPEWENHLKDLVDSYHKVKFVVSGSAAAALNVQSKESGAGRFTEFLLPPLSFFEYIQMTDKTRLFRKRDDQALMASGPFTTDDIAEVNRLFIDYLNFGGYPELILDQAIKSDPRRFVKEDILDKVLLRDLPNIFGISDIHELYAFFTFVAYNTGNETSPKSLSEKSKGVKKALVVKYLEYLEAAYLIRKVRRVDNDSRKFQRDNYFKLYLTNPSIRTALFTPLESSSPQIGAMVETVLFAQWFSRDSSPYYARWNRGEGEVDMVMLNPTRFKPDWALEIKWSDRYIDHPSDLKSLVKFAKMNGLERAWCTTINRSGIVRFADIDIHFIPAALYAYTLGHNAIHTA